jgi:hypothetical protein
MKNKPQWLIDAENEINEFADTTIGKMSDKEFRIYDRQYTNGVNRGITNNSNGTMEKAWKSSTSNPELQSNKGKKGGSITAKKEWTCPKCTKKGTGPTMTRHHMDNCTIWKPFKALPNDISFTKKEIMNHLNANGFNMTSTNVKQFVKNHPLLVPDGVIVSGKPTKYKKI